MAMIGAFLGGPDTTMPVGKAGISLCVNTTDRLNLATASFTVTASGFNKTVQADASGRGYIEVDAGKTYTVTLNHQGSYENDDPQTVIAESRMQYGVLFDLFDYPAVSTMVTVSASFNGSGVEGVSVVATMGQETITGTTGANGQAVLRGLDTGTWTISLPDYDMSQSLIVDDLIESVSFSLSGINVTLDIGPTAVTVSGPGFNETRTFNSSGTGLFGPVVPGQYTVSTAYETKTVTVGNTTIAITIKGMAIYGVCIAKSTSDPMSRVTYIEDNAGWTKGTKTNVGNWLTGKTPFTDIKPVMFDGTTWTDLDKRDLVKDANGSLVDITTLGNDVFAEIPTWWLSITDDGTYQYVRFASRKVDSTYKKLANLWKGADVGMFHYGCFHAYNVSNNTYSSNNRIPTAYVSPEGFRASCQARGEGYDKVMYHQRMYIEALCLLYFGTTNPQTILRGYVDASSIRAESITSFSNDLGIAGSTSGTDHMAFLWINDLWGNVSEIVGGAKTRSYSLQTLDNGEPDNTSGTGYVTHNTTPTSDREGYVSEMDCQSTEVGFLPKVCSGSSSTHWADYGEVYGSYFPAFGGRFNEHDRAGPFYVSFGIPASNKSDDSSRLSYRAGRS